MMKCAGQWMAVLGMVAVVGMTGCSTSKDKMFPTTGATMMDIYHGQGIDTAGLSGMGGTSTNQRQLMDARASLRRPLGDGIYDQQAMATAGKPTAEVMVARQAWGNRVAEVNGDYTRTAANEIVSNFPRLPNPDLVVYVLPHLAGNEPAPIPGYSTVIPFYSRIQYAMPGERLGDY